LPDATVLNDAKSSPRTSCLTPTFEYGLPCESKAVPEILAARPGISERSILPASCPGLTVTRRASLARAVPGKYVGA
jgi:hypothetical protein